MKMIDNKTKIIIGLCIVILLISGVYAYNFLQDKFYQVGFSDATLLINNQITTNLQQNGYIIFMFPIENNQTIPIKLIPEIPT